MALVQTGIMRLRDEAELQKKYTGNIGLLCHSASIDENYKHSIETVIDIYGDKLKKVFGPQHGFVTDVQDNMIETDHFTHPYFKLPIYSLYSETRKPTDEMLEGLDHIFIDLQDVGTRIYTYIYTMTYMLEKCAELNIEVVILDRPNPINSNDIEGNILEPEFASFVGRHPMPVRHGLTIGEVALMHQKYWTGKKANITIIEMKNYRRDMTLYDTKLPYVNPSPNLSTIESCFTFVGTVLFEGTSISEGRGTTRALEQIGHPNFKPWELKKHFDDVFTKVGLKGFVIRPVNFHPMFQKHEHQSCGGFFIHITDHKLFKAWKFAQVFLKEFKKLYPNEFHYKTDAYEYGGNINPIDMINGCSTLRQWYEQDLDNYEFLDEIESHGLADYMEQRSTILIYK